MFHEKEEKQLEMFQENEASQPNQDQEMLREKEVQE